jgi:hypothetical protein
MRSLMFEFDGVTASASVIAGTATAIGPGDRTP